MFKNGFGNISDKELKNIQDNLYELLKEFDQICKENDITYYLDGGSVIGALRHNDFIPWDDDIDVLMKVKDFKKFCQVLETKNYKRNDRILSFIGKKFTHHKPFARYVNTNILHVLPNSIAECNYLPGLFIDIFILDGVSIRNLEEYKSTLEISQEWFHNRLNGVVGKSSLIEYLLANLFEKIFGEGKVSDFYFKKLENLERNSKSIDFYVPRNGFNYAVYDADVFQNPKYVQFRDGYFPAPSKPEKFLRAHYSIDWFNIPDIESRFSHHFTLTSDCFTPNDFFKNHSWFNEQKKIHSVQKKRHFFQVLKKKSFLRTQKIYSKKYAAMLSLELNHIFNTIFLEKLNELDKKLNFQEINKLTDIFWVKQKQLTQSFPQVNEYISVNEEILHIILKARIMSGDFFIVHKFFRHNFNFSNQLIKHQISIVRNLYEIEEAMQDNEIDKAKSLLKRIPKEYQEASCIVKYKSFLGELYFSSIEEEYSYYKEIEERNGRYYDFDKIIADKYHKEGKFSIANKIYKEIYENHNNGLVLLDIKKNKYIEEYNND